MIRTHNKHLHKAATCILAGYLAIGTAIAEDISNMDTEVTTTDIETPTVETESSITDTTIAINQNVVEKISDKHRVFLNENSESVITGLRTGNEIILTTTGSEGTTTTAFTPPTGKMGYGNVSHAISLAKEQLAQYGITEPTANELQIALIGGDITTQSGGTANIDGVLTLRSEGMGWGDIAHEYGVKLGHIGNSNKTAQVNTPMDTSNSTGTIEGSIGSQTKVSNKSYKSHGKNMVTAAGGTSSSAKNIKLAAKQGQSYSYGHGIVTANGTLVTSGKSFGGNIKASSGKVGHIYGHGVTTAAGASVSSSGISSGKSGGKRLAKGHNK